MVHSIFGFRWWWILRVWALIIGLLYMMYRRKWLALPKLDYARPDRTAEEPDYGRSQYRREDWLFLWALILIGITGFLLEADRLIWLQMDAAVWDYRWWSPVGALIAAVLDGIGMTSAGAGTLRYSLWWFHGLLAFGFIGLLPFTKAKHIFTAMGSLVVRDAKSAARLPKTDPEAETIGYRNITDFTWKQLLHAGRLYQVWPLSRSLSGQCHWISAVAT